MPVGQLGVIGVPVSGRRRRKEIRIISQKALSVLGSPVSIVSRRGTLSLTVLSGKPNTPKPVALLMGSGKSSEGGLECGTGGNWVLDSLGGSLQCSLMGKASVRSPLVRPLPERSLDSGLDWCKPFMCQGTVKIDVVAYPITVFRDTVAQQSVVQKCDRGEC